MYKRSFVKSALFADGAGAVQDARSVNRGPRRAATPRESFNLESGDREEAAHRTEVPAARARETYRRAEAAHNLVWRPGKPSVRRSESRDTRQTRCHARGPKCAVAGHETTSSRLGRICARMPRAEG